MKNFKIQKTFFKVSDFINWKKQNTLNLNPNFQRRPVWRPGAKSYLIDTVVRNLPIPIIFLRERKTDLETLESKREVVDGQQRIRTLISYIQPSLLDDYNKEGDYFVVKTSHNKEIAGKKFNDLSDEYKRLILDYQFDVHILPSDIEDREVYDIFRRMNATGVKLNEQELRNANYYSVFKTTMYDLAFEEFNRFQDWGLFTSSDISRMKEVEFVSDLAVLMKYGVKRKSEKIINSIYVYYESEGDDNISFEVNIIKNRYRKVMSKINDIIGEEISNTLFKNKTLFYALFAVIYEKQYGIGSPLKKVKAKLFLDNIKSKIIACSKLFEDSKVPTEVLGAYEKRTTDLNARLTLINYIKNKLK